MFLVAISSMDKHFFRSVLYDNRSAEIVYTATHPPKVQTDIYLDLFIALIKHGGHLTPINHRIKIIGYEYIHAHIKSIHLAMVAMHGCGIASPVISGATAGLAAFAIYA